MIFDGLLMAACNYVQSLYGVTAPTPKYSRTPAGSKVRLFRNAASDTHPWTLRYGIDCVCSYSHWQQAVWDLPHAVAITKGAK